jgi:UDP-N-acetylglucosamine 1-carboxyvinyltransferase
MEKFIIRGGRSLQGEIAVSGAKNAALPIMAATLLAPGQYALDNVPELRDVRSMAHLLRIIGAKVERKQQQLIIDTTNADFAEAPYEIVKTMRASIYVLGPLLARFHRARVSLPGGCAWGPRPVDYHIKGMQQLGAQIELENGYILAKTATGLRGGDISFAIPSVGATGNVLMAASLAQGETRINNAAMEPEITALIDFLTAMGAKITGRGTPRLLISGVGSLHPINSRIISDRIEAGTFLTAVTACRGEVTVKNAQAEHLDEVVSKLREAGADIEIHGNEIQIGMRKQPKPVSISTAVYPGFPTDMQAQWMALMAIASGSSVITDTIYSDRFTHVDELIRLGAQISRKQNSAFIAGVNALQGASVMSTDLRASASLIIAGLAAHGETHLSRIYHIDRGYARIEEKLQAIGAEIVRTEEPHIV